jgi:uncharacterized protein
MLHSMLIKIRVTPRASKNEIIKVSETEYKVKLTAAPIDGEANEKLIKLLSKKWKVAKSRIRIERGEKSREKMVEINPKFIHFTT